MRRVALGEIADIVSGATPKSDVSDYWGGNVQWVTPADLSGLTEAYISTTPRTLTESGLRSCSAVVLPPGSVLLSSRAPIGHVAITGAPMATNQGFKSLVPRQDRTDAKYLYHWLRANRALLQNLGNGATFKEISKAVVARIEVPLPPIEEQRRIATILDHADALRAKRRQIHAHLGSLKQSLYEHYFGRVGDKESYPTASPVSDWLDPSRPVTYGILKPGPDIPDGVPYVRVADMRDGHVRLNTVRRTTAAIHSQYRRSTLRSGDLLMSIRGHVGRIVTIPSELDGANITQDSARLAVMDPDRAVYVRATLESRRLQAWMAARTKGAAVRGINLGDLRNAPIPEADDKTITRFAVALRQIETQQSMGALQSAHLDEAFTSLQARAFRGEL